MGRVKQNSRRKKASNGKKGSTASNGKKRSTAKAKPKRKLGKPRIDFKKIKPSKPKRQSKRLQQQTKKTENKKVAISPDIDIEYDEDGEPVIFRDNNKHNKNRKERSITVSSEEGDDEEEISLEDVLLNSDDEISDEFDDSNETGAKKRIKVRESPENPKKKRKLNLLQGIKPASKRVFKGTAKTKGVKRSQGIKSFTKLTTKDDFAELEVEAYIFKIADIPEGRLILHCFIENKIVCVTADLQAKLHHVDRVEAERWVTISGGNIELYQGNKQIRISAHTQIKQITKIGKPVPDFKKTTNIIQHYSRINSIKSNLLKQYFLAGYVEEIGKETRYGPEKKMIKVTLLDINGVGMDVNLWQDDDRKKAEKMKINNSVLLTKWKTTEGATVGLNSSGIIFINVELPKARKVHKMVKNLSVIDYDYAKANSPVITFFQACQAGWTGMLTSSPTNFYIMQYVKVTEISRMFKFIDKNGDELQEIIGGFRDVSGDERQLDEESDVVEYFVRAKIQDAENPTRCLYATGFKDIGEDLFTCTAMEMYKICEDNALTEKDVANKLKNEGLDLLVSTCLTKPKEELRFTLRGVCATYSKTNKTN